MTFIIGQSLNDDIWHTVTLRRRGTTIEASVDEEDSKKGIDTKDLALQKEFRDVTIMSRTLSSAIFTVHLSILILNALLDNCEKFFFLLQHYLKLNLCVYQ